MPAKALRKPAQFLAASAILLCVLFLVSCGNNGTPPIVCNAPSGSSSSPSCTCGATGTQACPAELNEYLYTSGGSGQILAFSITATTGALSGPTSSASGPASIGMAMVDGQFFYVSDPAHGQLDGFSVNQPGALGALAGSPFAVGQGSTPQGMVSPSGSQTLYVADASGVDAFTVSPAGVPTAISGSPFPSGANTYLTTDSYGQFLYTSIDDPPGGVYGFSIGTSGGLTEIAGSPFRIQGQTAPNSLPAGIIDNNSYVYAALTGSNQIAAFAVTTGTGVLTPVANSPFPAGNGPTALALSNNFLYAINSADSTISGYSIDSSTGVLTPLANSPFAIAGTALSADFTGQYLYVSGVSGIEGYSIDPNTGSLTIIAGSPFAASQVVSLTVLQE